MHKLPESDAPEQLRVLFIPAQGEPEIKHIPNTLPGLQEVIGGGFIERVNLTAYTQRVQDVHNGQFKFPFVMVVDEEGLIKRLPPNELATKLYLNTPRANPPFDHPYIAGDAFVLSEAFTPEGPDFFPLPEPIDHSWIRASLKL